MIAHFIVFIKICNPWNTRLEYKYFNRLMHFSYGLNLFNLQKPVVRPVGSEETIVPLSAIRKAKFN